MSTNLMPDDRRHLGMRLSALQYIIACAFAALAVGFLAAFLPAWRAYRTDVSRTLAQA